MAIYDYLPTFHVVEPNNLKGLQPGFVVAQMEVKNGCSLLKNGLFENGHICCIGADGIRCRTRSNGDYLGSRQTHVHPFH